MADKDHTITLNEGGTGERVIDILHIQIPDIWHIAHRIENEEDRKLVLEVWSLAHDMKRHLQDS